ncbi:MULTISPECIES: RHS repeat-associated core domain-containing protein [unclassified Streptomyces]|uniref:RHS repeat-associated core domain-containing protein n=1 Tax=Streptomyces sp. NBC_00304 TaxID=2975706 RepID=UPI002E2BD1FE|nr:RHS repeat-associated core domain-containing protein [Streptomyces sp. NBC_00304]
MAVTVPDWADTLLDLIGVAWPNVDEDAYRDMADALREFAEDLEDDGQIANNHVSRLLSSGTGESITALNDHWSKVKGKHIKDIADAARTIAGALDLAAGAVEGMKLAAIVQLGYLASEAGIALSLIPVTGGLSMLVGAGAMRATQEVVKRLIKECVEEAVGYVVSAMTEPVVAALEEMAADLVVQLGSVAIGLQDNVDLGQTKDAGTGGFKEGVQSGKNSMHLASADGSPGSGSGLKDLHIEHSEHDRAATQLNGVSVSIHGKTAGKLTKARTAHGRTRGRDSIASAIDPVADKALEALGKATKAMGDHVGTTLPKAVKEISAAHKATDDDIHDRFARLHQRDKGPGTATGGTRSGADHRKKSADSRAKPEPLDKAKADPRRHSIPGSSKTCKNDPVDVATGEMLMTHTDLSLAGTLPLVLDRTHLSNYRHGQWFGRTWASTLDERIEVNHISPGAVWARQDGSLLIYPRVPQPGGDPLLPVEGPRLSLAYDQQHEDQTTYVVADPRTGTTRYFTGSPYQTSSAYWLTGIEDRNGNRITITRSSDGAPTTVSHDGGYTVQVTTSGERITALHLLTPDGPCEVRRFRFNGDGHLSEIVNSSGLPLRLTYDHDGRVTSWTDRNDSTFRYLYDAAGRVCATEGPDGILSSSFHYGDVDSQTRHRITRYTDSTGATSFFHINEAFQAVAETDPLGNTTLFEFNAQDQLLAQTDALGRTTRFERDTRGNLTALLAPDGVRTTATYNDLGQPLTITERGGITRRFAYDGHGNRTSVTEPDGATTGYEFDLCGHLTAIHSPTGTTSRFANDNAGLPLRITAPDGAQALCARDAFGRLTTVTDALNNTVRMGWTTEGGLSWRELPDLTREEWTWDGENNLVTHTDRMGRTSTHTATHFDRRSSTHTPEGTDYEFTHDTELRLTKVTNSQGLDWNYTYDAAGRLVSETDFDGRTLTYEHDAVGHLTRRTNAAGQSLTYERDVLGRVIRLLHDDGTASTFTHGESGHVTRLTNAHTDITLDHDLTGRIVTETVNGRSLSFAYDSVGRRTHRRTPSGAQSSLTYTPQGLATYSAGNHTFNFTRDALGRETARTLDSRLALRQAWDSVGRLDRQSLTAPAAEILERTFTYQADGTPLTVSDSSAGTRTYTLDTASRVTAVHAHEWTEQYAYNTNGDQTSTTLPAQAPHQEDAGTRYYDGTRLAQAGRTSYTYDAQGRMTRRTTRTLSGKTLTWHFTWNAEDRLTQVLTPDTDTWHYLYDALGRRTEKQRTKVDGTLTERITYCWDGAQLAEQNNGTTTMVWDYAGLRPLAQRESKNSRAETDRRFFAMVTDLAGSPSELVDPEGHIAWKARSTAWGATQWNRGSIAYTPLRYPGQYFDAETGLHYNVNRYYDAGLGRYITPDPLGLAPATNHYAYVPNPFTMTDPLGLAGCTADPTWGGRVTFTRDEHGRPFEMNATVTRDMLDEGTDARQALHPPGFLGGVHNQARGHMLANRLGGSGDTLDNLFTITQNPTNTPDMRGYEDVVYQAVKKDGVATYNVYLEYSDDQKDSVPKYIQLEAFDKKGNLIVDKFLDNPAHGQQQRHRRGLVP